MMRGRRKSGENARMPSPNRFPKRANCTPYVMFVMQSLALSGPSIPRRSRSSSQ
jgi:hypothetical protein